MVCHAPRSSFDREHNCLPIGNYAYIRTRRIAL